ncbi:MAG: SGNH/GDSL hydrolase family protein, partial [Clostridia bacterium]|nr:SGNH/GDSL hydrolase family protein [Clostridia bacterium]
MKKKFVFCLLFAVLLCVTAYAAGTFKPVVSRIGIKGTNLRMVVQTSSLPVGLTAAQLEGALMNGKMTYKASEEGKGDITVVNSEIVGFEPGASTSVLVVASNDYLNVNNVDDGTGKYDCDLTVTMKETDVNQRSFKVNFSRGGNSTYMRLVVPLSDIPADLTPAELKNTVISGTLTHNTDQSLNLEFNNTVVSVEFNDTEAVFNVADGETAKKANFTVGRAYTGTLTVKIPVGEEAITVHKLNTSGANLSFYIRNMTKTARSNVAVIAAVYTEDNEMVDAEIKYASVGAFDATGKIDFVFEATKPWTRGKVMLFETVQSLRPCIGAIPFVYTDPDFAVPDFGGEDYGSVAQTDWKLDEFYEKEANVRDGIPNTYAKLEKGEPLSIVFVGGSVTQGYTWCESVLRWMRQEYPNCEITDYNIGLSGTGTEVGVIRTDSDILSKNPDLVFVEYGGNGGTDVTMEGIFRKIRKKSPNTDIVMVNTMHADWYQTYKDGNLPSNIARFEKIAEHYGVPFASFGVQVVEYYDKGVLSLAGEKQEGKILYAKDGIHPTTDGGQLAGGAVVRSLIRMKEKGTEAKAHTLPDAINE